MAEKGKEKVTMMKLKVDLDCDKCYKKVKKVLCKFPQIRDQLFDEKSNIVIIKVVCCSPERIMDKLCSKGGGSIKTIEIVQPPKPPQPQPQPQAQPPPQKPKDAPEKPKEAEKPKQPEKPKEAEKPKQPEKPKEPEKPKQQEKPKESDKPAAAKPAPAPAQAQAPAAAPKQAGPPPQAMPMMSQGQPVAAMCYGPYYDGFGGGPAFSGYGMPPQPQPQPYESYGRPVYDSWGGGPPPSYRQCNLNRCDYFSEENPQSCSIM
ncbi:hypothetical protein N665_0818s0019 [Sinapis alba]|nr:hypothetical protein N665_0818s0019 [Sinapis alba]